MISEKIKHLRKINKVTQKRLAKDLKISPQSISHYEAERRTPSLKLIKKIAEYFNISISYLVDDNYSTKFELIDRYDHTIIKHLIHYLNREEIYIKIRVLYPKDEIDIIKDKIFNWSNGNLIDYFINIPLNQRKKIISYLCEDIYIDRISNQRKLILTFDNKDDLYIDLKNKFSDHNRDLSYLIDSIYNNPDLKLNLEDFVTHMKNKKMEMIILDELREFDASKLNTVLNIIKSLKD